PHHYTLTLHDALPISTTMSCDAEAKATKSASQAIAVRFERGDRNAIPAIPAASASCVKSSHPRRRPRKGGTKRSIAGAHRNFQTDRKSTRLNSSHDQI